MRRLNRLAGGACHETAEVPTSDSSHTCAPPALFRTAPTRVGSPKSRAEFVMPQYRHAPK